MPANNALQITGTDFDDIKSNLRGFLSSQTKFTDYNFDDSTIGLLIDLLSYNTYYNSVYLNQVANEMYLDSALLRNNVVSRAKAIGYTPSSARGAQAKIQLTMLPNDAPDNITIPKDTKFTTSIDGRDFTLVTVKGTVVNAASSYSANVGIVEGFPLTHRFTVSSTNPVRYVVPNRSVDSTSIGVSVQASSSNTAKDIFIQATNLTEVTKTSKIWYLQENEDQKFEVTFGDGVLGKGLIDGNIVQLDYRICHGTDVNGATTFKGPSAIAGYSNFRLVTTANTAGGANIESVTSIKFNAPKFFETQNRAVTQDDYKRIILAENPDLQAVRVWGGEENDPPIYGKVYIAAKPTIGTQLSQARKDQLRVFLEERNVMSIDPEFVDASYLYMVPEIEIRYDPEITVLTAGEVSNLVENSLRVFESQKLNNFNNNLYKSQLGDKLCNADQSIVSCGIKLRMQKRFQPSKTATITYRLPFNNAIENDHVGHLGVLDSSSFTYSGHIGTKMESDGHGNVRFYYVTADGLKVITNNAAGTIEYGTGLITLNSVLISDFSGADVKVTVKVSAHDVFTRRNQIPLFADASITVYNDRTSDIESTVLNVTTTGTSTQINESGITSVTF
jgi:hypothetical protein